MCGPYFNKSCPNACYRSLFSNNAFETRITTLPVHRLLGQSWHTADAASWLPARCQCRFAQHPHAVGVPVGKDVGRMLLSSAEHHNHSGQCGIRDGAHVKGHAGKPYRINTDHQRRPQPMPHIEQRPIPAK